MDYPQPCSEPEESDAIIVKADEVDEAGADISTIVPSNSSETEFDKRIESRRAQDAQAGGSPKVLANAVPSAPKWWARPPLRRDGSAAPPPQQPPPPAPPQQREEPQGSTDSLSLSQLKKLVTDLPKYEPTAYAYEYEDTRSFPEELEEWFQYNEEDRYILLRSKQIFEEKWAQTQSFRIADGQECLEWPKASLTDRESFVLGAVQALSSAEGPTRVKGLECISYVALGAWADTAGLEAEYIEPGDSGDDPMDLDPQFTKSRLQLNWIHNGARLLCRASTVPALVDILGRICKSEQDLDQPNEDQALNDDGSTPAKFLVQMEITYTLTTLYVLVEAGRWEDTLEDEPIIQQAFADIGSDLLILLTQILAKLRWEDSSIFPVPRVLLLFWKTILFLFGGSKDLDECKAVLRDGSDQSVDKDGEDFITASPLDYHLFRQEITSKYPSYSPPPPLVPIELENNSILPPLPNHPSRRTSQEQLHTRVGPTINGGGSIFNQPVHIATPAPSPPPSPAGPGGKGGKKQNYQTNQNFPFLYPPLDDASNTVGGKGKAELQDQLVGKRWEGSDVPASILEAGQLFASRMRMSRSIRQLWDVREKYIKYERGWNGTGKENEEIRSTNLTNVVQKKETSDEVLHPNNGPKREKETENVSVQRRLNAVEQYYRCSLPHLQSLVIVLWKVTFANVSALVSQTNGPNGMQNGFPFAEDNSDSQGKRRTNPNSAVPAQGPNGQNVEVNDINELSVDELNAVRIREITSKAVSGILILLLKWLKISHVLKFEYLTQLLLDANYLPLILKLFAHQDIDRAVDQKNDRPELGLFNFCSVNSHHPPPTTPPLQPPLSPSSSEDESQPPPIPTHRRSPTMDSSSSCSSSPPPDPPPPLYAEVDELGYTTTALPASPLTNYSSRFFFTTITLLRLLQKITKRKAHRALLLVQYKSSTILRRALKIPQPQLRLYTLKLFKSQVPYCGRKWRQTNMRVITAVYLHCRPELRDEWLCGGDVDGVVEEAVPLEQAGRSLVHWWHLRNYRDVMEDWKIEGKGGKRSEEGQPEKKDEEDGGNFFERELERMGWGIAGGGSGGGGGGGGGVGDEEDGMGIVDGGGLPGTGEWEGGPLQLEGWT